MASTSSKILHSEWSAFRKIQFWLHRKIHARMTMQGWSGGARRPGRATFIDRQLVDAGYCLDSQVELRV